MQQMAKHAAAKLTQPVVPPTTKTKRKPNSRRKTSEITIIAKWRIGVLLRGSG
jgi:hypothetical protein